MIEPIFLSVDDVLELHLDQIDEFGGIHGIRDDGLLESAVMTPQVSFGGEYLHSDLFQMAAAYAFHIAENQPFLDGNKRTALTSALTFLRLNGISILDPEMRLYDALIDIANRNATKSDLSDLLGSLPTE
jgi:death-on-curing protein